MMTTSQKKRAQRITEEYAYLDKPYDEMTQEERRQAVDLAERLLRREYRQDVLAIADDLRQEITDGDIEDEEGADEWLRETVGGHERVIYTAQNFDTLRWSENHDAYMDEGWGSPLTWPGSINWQGLAMAALLADVREELGALEFPRVTGKVRKAVAKMDRERLWVLCELGAGDISISATDEDLRTLVLALIDDGTIEPEEVL